MVYFSFYRGKNKIGKWTRGPTFCLRYSDVSCVLSPKCRGVLGRKKAIARSQLLGAAPAVFAGLFI